jgi:hypothetical protein
MVTPLAFDVITVVVVALAALVAAISILQAAFASRECVVGAVAAAGTPAGTVTPHPLADPPFIAAGVSAPAGIAAGAAGPRATATVTGAPQALRPP